MDDELQTLENHSMRRHLRFTDSSLINFASNNYLGLARDPEILAGAESALRQWGAGASSSRLLSGHTAAHADLESALAQWLKQEAALVFPAGYMANLGVITALAGGADAIVMDRLCHASLIDAARLSGARLLVYRHGDVSDAARVLKRAQAYRRCLLVTESLFSMDGDIAPLAELKLLARAHGALAIVDEAHALGVMGPRGRGLSEGWDIVLGTLSKSLGSQGGFAAGSRKRMDYFVNKARLFIFTTGLAPVCAAAALAALRKIGKTPRPGEALLARAQRLRAALVRQGWNVLQSQSQIVPVHVGDAEKTLALAGRLRDQGFYAPAIRPPAVHARECRLRLSLTAEHTQEQIDRLLSVLGECHE
jgi:8-amino-7-oxononanoate synthase